MESTETIHYALPKLVGVARTWYHGLPTPLLSSSEWKRKLIESFPCREDFSELLTEMLAKRVKYGEPLEHYNNSVPEVHRKYTTVQRNSIYLIGVKFMVDKLLIAYYMG